MNRLRLVGAAALVFSAVVTGTAQQSTRDAPALSDVRLPLLVVPQAAYDPTLKAPRCAAGAAVCDAGPTVLLGRDSMLGGPEPNQPNTINNSCPDGTTGTFHSDEAMDRLKVSTLDGTPLAPGKTALIEATVWVWAPAPTLDRLDLYYTADANNPAWTFITALTSSTAGPQTLSATYVLPAGGLPAVRAVFRFQGSASPCAAGSEPRMNEGSQSNPGYASREHVISTTLSSNMSGHTLLDDADLRFLLVEVPGMCHCLLPHAVPVRPCVTVS